MITGTTKQNELQLIKFLEKHKQSYWLRQVLLSKYTDNIQDLKKLGLFIKKLKYMVNFELLPYHRAGVDKYQQLGLSYKLIKSTEPTKTNIAQSKSIIQY
jgi:pyruvate formate lyase activating enzyme